MRSLSDAFKGDMYAGVADLEHCAACGKPLGDRAILVKVMDPFGAITSRMLHKSCAAAERRAEGWQRRK